MIKAGLLSVLAYCLEKYIISYRVAMQPYPKARVSMMRNLGRRILFFFGLCFVFGLVLLPAQAQGQNLLTNPGFEKPFVTLDGNPPRQVAQGWSPWNLSGGQSTSENIQPSYFPASDVTDGLG